MKLLIDFSYIRCGGDRVDSGFSIAMDNPMRERVFLDLMRDLSEEVIRYAVSEVNITVVSNP